MRNIGNWMNQLIIIASVVCLFACQPSQQTTGTEQLDSLRNVLATSELVELEPDNLHSMLVNTETEQTISRTEGKFLYDLNLKDTSQFEQSHNLIILGKIFENQNILTVAFRDHYDYKNAIHIFNFSKPELNPTSSFIAFDYGGDGEDFWKTDFELNDSLTFRIQQSVGRYNDIANQDTMFIESRITQHIRVNLETGGLSKKLLDKEENLIEPVRNKAHNNR